METPQEKLLRRRGSAALWGRMASCGGLAIRLAVGTRPQRPIANRPRIHNPPHSKSLSRVLPARRKSNAGKLPQGTKGRLCRIEAETKIFLAVIPVVVRGFMMVRV
jgi:hypothetical protein